ncbi:FMN binding oxidoreductase [Malassezia pachydermatis]|uniref:Nadh oxidase n=1 Tax=Malassezia pachydermatis TaxID=77020 RepID=A0A0M9VNX9_9BASI|nr:nadh oxidase [Malassezia pachydermatis]KOS13843.1 nadh oxidase [Malassezia pachydermatis]
MSSTEKLQEKLVLPCGAVMPNRLVKAPLEEMLSTLGGGNPTEGIFSLYRTWADGGWGMIITGNVSVDSRYIGCGFDVVIPTQTSTKCLDAFAKYARATKGYDIDDMHSDMQASEGSRPLAVVQLVHCGRQSMRGCGRLPWQPAVAPSAVPVQLGSSPSWMDWIAFGTPRALSKDDVHDVIARFVHGAVMMEAVGFDGIELHAAHGYLLSCFLNPRTNLRTDEYGGSPENRFRIIREIITEIRKRVKKTFIVGIKLNSSDYIQGGQTEDDALQNVKWLAEMRMVDFVEVSGGSYEAPEMLKPVSERTKRREGFFAEFARRAHESLSADSTMRIIVTGGFHSRQGMRGALESGIADGIGLGRPACLEPALPHKLLDPKVPDDEAQSVSWPPAPAPSFIPKTSVAGIGWGTFWHSAQLHLIARKKPTDPNLSMIEFLRHLRLW